jgi:hypothetical protein
MENYYFRSSFKIPKSKLTEYVLNPEHISNSGKAKAFALFGYTLENPEALADLILSQIETRLLERRPSFRTVDILFEAKMMIKHRTLKMISKEWILITAWQQLMDDNNELFYRLTTCYLKRRK